MSSVKQSTIKLIPFKFHSTLLTAIFFIVLSSFIASPAFTENKPLDTLFQKLKDAPSEIEARKIETLIWKQWLISGDSHIDELMQNALRKRRSYNFDGALEILNQVISLKPNFSEVWNQRATVYFHQGLYEKSLEDIAKTLGLEPRHFGSLAGRAVIRLKQNKPALAIQNIKVALEFHPYLKERNMFPNI